MNDRVYKCLSASFFRVETFHKVRLAIFPLPVATKKGTVCHLRGPVCLEWLCVCLLRVSAGARYIAASLSGSGVGASDGHPIRLVS